MMYHLSSHEAEEVESADVQEGVVLSADSHDGEAERLLLDLRVLNAAVEPVDEQGEVVLPAVVCVEEADELEAAVDGYWGKRMKLTWFGRWRDNARAESAHYWLDGWLKRGKHVTTVTAAADVWMVLDEEKRVITGGAECIIQRCFI